MKNQTFELKSKVGLNSLAVGFAVAWIAKEALNYMRKNR